MKITSLPDAERRPRAVAVGTFDGVHLGHRRVIDGLGQRAHLRSAPGLGGGARAHAQAAHARPTMKAELIAGARRAGAGRDPLHARVRRAQRARVHRRRARGHARGDARGGGGELPLRAQGAGDAGAARRADARFETVVHPLLEVEGEVVSSSHIRGLVAAGEVAKARALPRGALRASRRGRARRRNAAASLASRPPTWCRTSAWCCPGHGVYACLAGTAAGGLAEAAAAAVSIGVRPTFGTGRGELIEAYLLDFEGDLYGQRAAPALPPPPARRAAFRERRGARRADAWRRRAARASSSRGRKMASASLS